MLNSISKAIISSAIIITPFLATSQVQADDENTYDASFCVTLSGTPTLGTSGAITNDSSTTTLSVRCPIQRDRNRGTLDSDHSFVLVRDHTNKGSVRCYLRQNLLGSLNTLIVQTAIASTDNNFSSTEYRELAFPKKTFTNTDEGSFYLYCTMPPKQGRNLGSSISSYYIDED